MESSQKRLFTAVALSVLALVLWSQWIQYRYPLPPRPSSQAAASAPDIIADHTPPTLVSADKPTAPLASSRAATSGLAVVGDDRGEAQEFQIGRDEPAKRGDPSAWWAALRLTSRGGSIDRVDLTQYRNTVAESKDAPPETYDLLQPWTTPDGTVVRSFSTAVLQLIDYKLSADLRDANWRARQVDATTVEFETEVQHHGAGLVRVRKRYQLSPGSFDLKLALEVENISDKPIALALTQEGPINLRHDAINPGAQYEDRFIVVGVTSGSTVSAAAHRRTDVEKAEEHRLDLPSEDKLRGLSHVNKWFAVIMSPAAVAGAVPLKIAKAQAFARTADASLGEDMQMSLVLQPGDDGRLAPGASAAVAFDTYIGPKDHDRFISSATYRERGYDSILDATGGSCGLLTFHWLTALMRWLLAVLHVPLRNYGVAIIVLVILVRASLHWLTKRNQLRMMRMQKAMQRIAPKVEALKARHANDPAALNRETMKLYSEEGISPFSQVWTCLPMFIQMPIWVALWTTLNTTIGLRHAPFMLWMRDLAAPDALIQFDQAYSIPLLSWLTGPIHSLNILPIVMGITMYLQQKLTQKLTRPDTPPPATPSADGKPSAADQMRQQQTMMNVMSIMFSFMFYSFPCGLNLYIFTSNLFGMLEQWIIRKEIHSHDLKSKAAGGDVPPAKKKPPAWWGRLQERLQEAQRLAEEARRDARSGGDGRSSGRKVGKR